MFNLIWSPVLWTLHSIGCFWTDNLVGQLSYIHPQTNSVTSISAKASSVCDRHVFCVHLLQFDAFAWVCVVMYRWRALICNMRCWSFGSMLDIWGGWLCHASSPPSWYTHTLIHWLILHWYTHTLLHSYTASCYTHTLIHSYTGYWYTDKLIHWWQQPFNTHFALEPGWNISLLQLFWKQHSYCCNLFNSYSLLNLGLLF